MSTYKKKPLEKFSPADLGVDPAPRLKVLKVPCGSFSSAASIWPVWLASSSMACLPSRMMPADSLA